MKGGLIRVGANGFLDQLYGLIVTANLESDQAQQMIGLAVIWLNVENLPVQGFRLTQLAGTMRLNSIVNNVVEKFLRHVRLGPGAFFSGLFSSHFLLLTFLRSVH